jgi:hypothetical protein
MSETELALHLGVQDLIGNSPSPANQSPKQKRLVRIQSTTATTGDGLEKGFDWYMHGYCDAYFHSLGLRML